MLTLNLKPWTYHVLAIFIFQCFQCQMMDTRWCWNIHDIVCKMNAFHCVLKLDKSIPVSSFHKCCSTFERKNTYAQEHCIIMFLSLKIMKMMEPNNCCFEKTTVLFFLKRMRQNFTALSCNLNIGYQTNLLFIKLMELINHH